MQLIDDPWVSVLRAGRATEVSLREALVNAHELDGLDLAEPLAAVAVLRQVLIPACLDALGAPRSGREWAQRWAAGRLDEAAVTTYLKTHRDRFDLFHPATPFGQVADLATARGEVKPLSVLLPEVPSGNNVPLMVPVSDAVAMPLPPSAALRALLQAQCFDTAAIKSGAVGDPKVSAGKTTGNPTGPAGQLGLTVPLGRTLFETLLLNLPVLPQGLRPADRPQWRGPALGPLWESRAPAGLLDLLTFQSRRARLVPDQDRAVVSGVVLCAGDRLSAGTPEYEPHTMWRHDKPSKGSSQVEMRRPARHNPERGAWQGLEALLTVQDPQSEGISTSGQLRLIAELKEDGHLPEGYPLHVLTARVVYGNQSAVVEDVTTDLIPLPLAALSVDSPARQLAEQCARQGEVVRRAGNALSDDLRRSLGGDGLPWDKSFRIGERLTHQLGRPARRVLALLQRQPTSADEVAAAWAVEARRLCLAELERELATAAPAAFLGRRPDDGKWPYCVATAERRFRSVIDDEFPPPARTTEA